MSHLVKELSATDLKEFISSSRACKIDDKGIILESKFGKVVFDFSTLYSHKIGLHAKRISGNGKIILKSGEFFLEPTIHSKLSQCIDSPVYDHQVEISRSELESTGEVCIFGLSLYADTHEIEGDILATNWKSTIAKCGSYSNIRMIGNRLFASAGAYLEHGFVITAIETVPPDCIFRDDGSVKFKTSCEIVKIEVDPKAPVTNTSIEVFEQREPAPALVPSFTPVTSQGPTINKIKHTPFRSRIFPTPPKNPILYDSQTAREFDRFKPRPSKKAKFHNSSGRDYLVLFSTGVYTISASWAQPNTEYVVVISGKKMSGNGKIELGFVTTGQVFQQGETVVIDNQMADKYVKVRTGSNPPAGDMFRLAIAMLQGSAGEVLIEKIRVIDGINIENSRDRLKETYAKPLNKSEISIGYNLKPESGYTDPVHLLFKRYSRITNSVKVSKPITQQGLVYTTNLSGKQWINKIQPLCSKVDVRETPEAFMMGSIGNLLPMKKIWLEPFEESEFSVEDAKILCECQTIHTPSFSNFQFLSQQFPKVNIKQSIRPWLWVPPRAIKFLKDRDFVLCFDRHAETTNRLLECYTNELVPLVIVGARGDFPPHVIAINEYLPYNQIIWLLCNTRCLIDLPHTSDYSSSILDMAFEAKIPTVTTNWYGRDKENSTFLTPEDIIDGVPLPNKENLFGAIIKCLGREKHETNLINYNDKAIKIIAELLD
jgi:hypothetical protein